MLRMGCEEGFCCAEEDQVVARIAIPIRSELAAMVLLMNHLELLQERILLGDGASQNAHALAGLPAGDSGDGVDEEVDVVVRKCQNVTLLHGDLPPLS